MLQEVALKYGVEIPSGTAKDPGILPRVMEATFHHIQERQYEGMDLKPHLRSGVQHLSQDKVKKERTAKAAIFTLVKEVRKKTLFQTF